MIFDYSVVEVQVGNRVSVITTTQCVSGKSSADNSGFDLLDSIHGMCAVSRISDRTLCAIVLFRHVEFERFAVGMLAVPDVLWQSVLEANHVMLPIANVVSDIQEVEIDPAEVERVEIHVKSIDQTISLVIHDYYTRHRSFGFSTAVRLHTE